MQDSNHQPSVVVVGASHAASQAVTTLRKEGFSGEIVMIGDEPYLPYHRPPLSKQYVVGKQTREQLQLKTAEFYQKHDISVLLDTKITALDPQQREVTTSDGTKLSYDRLLLTTGGRPRRLPIPGAELNGVSYLRTITDVDRIRQILSEHSRVCIIGGGYIGLEFASSAVSMGAQVTVLEAQERLLKRVTTPYLSDFYYNLHSQRGVEIRLNAMATQIIGEGHVSAVKCGEDVVEADLVVIGIGIIPNVELAQAAGVSCDNGVVVDKYCRTSEAAIFAAGDCTVHPNSLLERTLRLESVPNALEQAKVAATNIARDLMAEDADAELNQAANRQAGDQDTSRELLEYAAIPWFWSDQYELKLQMVGFSGDGTSQVVRGDVAGNKFAVFHLHDGRLVAVDAVNSPREFMMCRKHYGSEVDAERLANADVELKDVFI